MKKAIAYARISKEDQSHYSISGQIEQMEEYSIKNHYNLVKTFVDEGQSAKNFNRRNWKILEAYLKIHFKSIDYLIVYKYDRFSRNVHESLEVIHKLEEVYKIRIISVSEPIGLPVESPFYFQMRTQMLLQAHVERLIIKDRTKFGMNKAKREGRFIGKAPYGYRNGRDGNNRPILKIEIAEASIVQKIFDWFAMGITAAETRRKAKAIGYPQRGKDAIHNILRNPAYCGMLTHPDGPGYVEAVHSPIISKELFLSVQVSVKRPELPQRKYNDEAYMKAKINCPECFRPLTCGKSKGKNKYYWYYECTAHRKSYRLDAAHDRFNNILDELSFSEDQIQYMEETVSKMLQAHIKETEGSLPILTAKRAEMLLKKEALEEKYLMGKLDDETFANWSTKLKSEIKQLDNQIKIFSENKGIYWTRFADQIENLKSIKSNFQTATTPQKAVFIEKGFGKGLVYDGTMYRTPYLNPIFQHKALVLRRKGLLEVYKKTEILDESPLWVPNTDITEHFLTLFDWFDSIKTA